LFAERPRTFLQSVLALIGHLCGTAVIFLALIIIAWGISFVFAKLHAIHNFPEQIYAFITTVELTIVYIDALASAIVLIVGLVRFCRDLIRG
jgi:hypothetical protein